MASYLPLAGGELQTWAGNFARHIASAPAAYGLGAVEADKITQVVEAYAAAYTLAAVRQTRTMAQVANKNAARKAMLRVIRRYAQLIRANPAVAEKRRIEVGLRSANSGRTPISAPDTRPLLHVIASAPCRHLLRYQDAENPDGKRAGKPRNVIGLQLFCHVGENAPSEPLEARFERFLSRQPYTVEFKGPQVGSPQVGKKAFYYARWQSATGETGPWSQVASLTIAG